MATTAKKPQDHLPKQAAPEVEEDAPFEKVQVDVPLLDDDGQPLRNEAGEVVTEKRPAMRGSVRGIEVTVLNEALDDFEVLDDIRAATDEDDASRVPALLRRLVGDQYRDVLRGLRGPNGRVSVEAGTDFVFALLRSLNPNL